MSLFSYKTRNNFSLNFSETKLIYLLENEFYQEEHLVNKLNILENVIFMYLPTRARGQDYKILVNSIMMSIKEFNVILDIASRVLHNVDNVTMFFTKRF